jgi:lysophospholipase L1-like esterase
MPAAVHHQARLWYLCGPVHVRLLLLLLIAAAGLPGCGGGSPSSPSTPAPTYPVTAVVFYDENGNGVLDATEAVRLPEVDVDVSGHVGRTEKLTGRAVVNGVPAGSYPATLKPASMPPFYTPVGMPPVAVPQPAGTEADVPVTLPIGSNVPNTYLAFGDSITVGDGARSTDGYRNVVEELLAQNMGGRHHVINDGVEGSKTDAGYYRIERSLRINRPAYILILYGTNDWNKNKVPCTPGSPCSTVDNLRFMVQAAKAVKTLPVISTIIPSNPNMNPPERNEWVVSMNDQIKAMARQEGAALADSYGAFMKAGNLPSLFVDHVHPNDAGYQLIAGAFFIAIARPPAATSSGRGMPVLFLAPTVTSGNR